MVETILKLFMSEQQAQSVLSHPVIEVIFLVLFMIFAAAFLIHVIMYMRLKRIRHLLNMTDSMNMEPLRSFKADFDKLQTEESVKVETFIQQKFSSWRMFNVPVVSLIKMIQTTVSMFILIGVLGTFIGLTMSLGSIDVTSSQIVENVASVLAGIDVAFYTSIAGMGLSLIMTAMLRAANTEYLLTDIMLKMESHLEENEQDTMASLIEAAETINSSIVRLEETNQQSLQNIEDSFKGFQEYTVGLQKAAGDLNKFNAGLSENLQEFNILFTNMKEVTEGFGDGVTKLNDHFDQLFSYFTKTDRRNENISQAFQYTYKKIEELADSQTRTLDEFQNSVSHWQDYLSTMTDRQESTHAAFEKANTQSDDLVKLMKENNKQFKGIFGADVSSRLSDIHASLRELAKDFDRLGGSIGQLPEALDMISQTQSDYKRLLTDRFDDLKEFNKEFNRHLKAHTSESAAFDKQLNEAASSFEQLGSKNNQLIHDINRILHQMTDSFAKRETHIEAGVGVLQDTLSRYVANLDGTLGEKLDKVSRNISDYVVEMNGAIKKEFKQINDITEDYQQKNSRLTQQAIQDLNQEFHNLNRQLRSFAEEGAPQSHRVRAAGND